MFHYLLYPKLHHHCIATVLTANVTTFFWKCPKVSESTANKYQTYITMRVTTRQQQAQQQQPQLVTTYYQYHLLPLPRPLPLLLLRLLTYLPTYLPTINTITCSLPVLLSTINEANILLTTYFQPAWLWNSSDVPTHGDGCWNRRNTSQSSRPFAISRHSVMNLRSVRQMWTIGRSSRTNFVACSTVQSFVLKARSNTAPAAL